MGVGVSGWQLARAVALAGQLGVVSGTALAEVLLQRLQQGDPGGDMRRALAHFPVSAVAERITDRYFVEGGVAPDAPPPHTPMPRIRMSPALTELTVAANFAEVHLAREGHGGLVGINYLEKIQLPTLASLFGALLAGVDYVLMGAGIPLAIPAVLDELSQGRPVRLRIDVAGEAAGEEHFSHFDPQPYLAGVTLPLKRPRFLAIVSSATLAKTLCRRAHGEVNGFVVEGPTAGGHNAPPRGTPQFNARGEPVYGPRDVPELETLRELGRPFWLAGGYADPARLAEALQLGATGVQVGTAFAFCDESGLPPELKRRVLALSRSGGIDVFTDPGASPTGFPFKILRLDDTLSDPRVISRRPRVCDIGYLRQPYRTADGGVGYRCAAEPEAEYVAKGGRLADTVGRQCLCSALMAAVGLGRRRTDRREEPLITSGEEAAALARFLPPGRDSYSAASVIAHILGKPRPADR